VSRYNPLTANSPVAKSVVVGLFGIALVCASAGCVNLGQEGENLISALVDQVESFSLSDGTADASSDTSRSDPVAVSYDELAAQDPYTVGSHFDPTLAGPEGFDTSGLYADDVFYAELRQAYIDVYGVEPDAATLEAWYAAYVYYYAYDYSQGYNGYDSGEYIYDDATGTNWWDAGTWSYGYNDGTNSGYSNSLLDTSVSSSGDSGYIYLDGDFVSW
jgi:hypothetical protein